MQDTTRAAMDNDRQIQHKVKFRKKLSVFLLCMLLSVFMWLFIKLTHDYTVDFHFDIEYRHYPKNLVLTEAPDSVLAVGVNSKGFELITAHYLHGSRHLIVDFNEFRIRHNLGGGYYTHIVTAQLMPQIGKQLPSSRSIEYVSPDTLTLHFTNATRKKVPVLLRLNTSFRKQYQLYDRIEVKPDSVFVTASREVLDTLRYIETKSMTKKNLDENQRFSLPLILPLKPGQLRVSSDTVEVFIPVEKYTEATISLPILPKQTSSKFVLKTFPDKCTITCLVPLRDFRSVDADLFSVFVSSDPAKIQGTNKLKVELAKSPARVKVLKIVPEEVEFIFLK
jgi:hypothetical protein